VAALAAWRHHYEIGPLAIDTDNDFPTAAGLASSASGFAALITAVNDACSLGLDPSQRSALARVGSGSAARSIYGGFVSLEAPEWQARQLATASHWPLAISIAVTTRTRKAVSSSEGMERSRLTSPYYDAWLAETAVRHDGFIDAIASRDFDQLAQLSEASCLAMHALMLSSQPGLIYWSAATVACLHAVRDLRAAGEPVFFTVDAGPQVKAVCEPQALERVSRVLRAVEGVEYVLESGLGDGASLIATTTP
jgi:diphosphomevalonate decarboxylase